MLELFITFFKIGVFTFGGGYGMISLVKDECVDKKKWIANEEFVDLIAVAESTPGPIAINMATYIGYKRAKLFGAIISTIAVVLPSLLIIYLITVYFKNFLNIKIVANAFMGIRVAIGIIIIKSAYKLIKDEMISSEYKKLTLILFILYFIVMCLIYYLKLNISSVALILSSIFIGIALRREN